MDISVCIGSACHIQGSYNIIALFQHMIEENQLNDKVNVKASFCAGQCDKEGVCVKIDSGEAENVTNSSAKNFFITHVVQPLQKQPCAT